MLDNRKHAYAESCIPGDSQALKRMG